MCRNSPHSSPVIGELSVFVVKLSAQMLDCADILDVLEVLDWTESVALGLGFEVYGGVVVHCCNLFMFPLLLAVYSVLYIYSAV